MDYILHIAIIAVIFCIVVVSLNYVVGYTGILSISHASFVGVGAYTSAILMKQFDMSFLLAILLVILITAFVAFLTAIPVLRLKDDSLMLISFGFALIYFNVMLNWTSLTNGALGVKGIPAIEVFGIDFSSKLYFLGLCLFFLLMAIAFFHKIVSSPYGTVIKGIRENESVMQNMGHNTMFYKYSVYIVGAVFAGIAGALYAPYLTYIEPSLFNLLVSVYVLIMAILGGLGNIWGSLWGTIILIVFPELLRFIGLPNSIMAETQQILYGLLLFLLMYLRPQGLLGNYKL